MGDVEGKADRNRKRRLILDDGIKNTKLMLVLKIVQGFTINERNPTQPYNGHGYYRVMAWTNAENEKGTTAIKSFGNSHWFNQELVIPLNSPADQCLYIEFLRGASWEDPGTANGTTVMGRAKIQLPPRSSRDDFTSYVDLVGLNSDGCVVFKGRLQLSMKIHEYVYL